MAPCRVSPHVDRLVATLLVVLGIAVVGAGSAQGGRKQPVWPAEGIKDFSLVEARGQTVTKADLLGRPWLAAFIFTHCAGPCPLVSEQMEILQERLAGLDVRLVSITVDPERDTPEVLKAYAEKYHADPERWWFLTGDKDEIRRLIRGSFKMIVEDAAKPIPGFEIEHSTTIMHVNAQGRVMGQYNAQNDVDMARLRRVMLGKSDPVDSKLIEEDDALEVEAEKRQEELRLRAMREVSEPAREAGPVKPGVAPEWVYRLPTVNAGLNALATLLLLTGFVLIKTGRPEGHMAAMLAAFSTSCLFLAFYVVYHTALWYFTDSSSKRFDAEGAIRNVYLVILASHIVLAMAVPVLASITIYRGLCAQWEKHRRIARITLPIWLYVSVTGVIIYLMLYHWPRG